MLARRLRSRKGFTLVELLVAMAVLASLAAMLVPAVQSARAYASRVECQNNMRQIGLALLQYHDARRAFPPAFSTTDMPYLSWQGRILPYIGEQALWEKATQAFGVIDWPWQRPHPIDAEVRTLRCTLDMEAARAHSAIFFNANKRSRRPGLLTLKVAFTSYLGNSGSNLNANDGVFAPNVNIKLTSITDGASNTLLAGERPTSAEHTSGWWYAAPGQNFTGSRDVILGMQELNVTRPNCPPGPYRFRSGNSTNSCDLYHFWSQHSSGANFLLADGGVRFLSYHADAALMLALATRGGREVLSLD